MAKPTSIIVTKPSIQHEEGKNGRDERIYKDAVLCCKLAAGHAQFQQIKRFADKSRLDRFDDELLNVTWPSIRRKDILGEGAFSVVHKVQVPSLSGQKYYALKHIKPDITDGSKDFRVAAVDLAVEGELLSRLRHENIIRLYGVYGGNPKTSYVDFKDGYFLLIDILEDTLTRKLLKMRRIAKKKKRNGNYTMLNMIQKVAIGVARGLEYLHEKGVILRDLKPDNVGFNENGKPVIFDLGFARELHTVHKSEVAGSLRYMSPEIGLSQGATLASDVYSFGVLLYEMVTLEKPFKAYKGRPEFIQDVFLNNYRPDLKSINSKSIRDLIANCWDKNHQNRPSMKTAGNILRVETALLNVRQQCRTRSHKPSTIRVGEQQNQQISSSNVSNLSLSGFSSMTSLRSQSMSSRTPSMSSLRSPSSSSKRSPGTSMNSTIRSSIDLNSFSKRQSGTGMRRMGSENFVWNTEGSNGPGGPSANKQFGQMTSRGRNSLTSSLGLGLGFDRRRRSSSNRMLGMKGSNHMKRSDSTDSFGLSNIEEGNTSTDMLPVLSSHRSRRGLSGNPSFSRLSSDSLSSFVSMGGDSCATDMSASDFTLGELKPRKLGVSRRSGFFTSFSNRALFTIDIDRASECSEDNNANTVTDDSMEDLSSGSSDSEEVEEVDPTQGLPVREPKLRQPKPMGLLDPVA